jgi:hypothetical protein
LNHDSFSLLRGTLLALPILTMAVALVGGWVLHKRSALFVGIVVILVLLEGGLMLVIQAANEAPAPPVTTSTASLNARNGSTAASTAAQTVVACTAGS